MSIQTIKQLVVPVLKQYGIKKASLFGSIVRGDDNINSDIDILVEIPDSYTGLNYFSFRGDLQNKLEQVLSKKIDLVEYRLIKSTLKKYILPEQIQIL